MQAACRAKGLGWRGLVRARAFLAVEQQEVNPDLQLGHLDADKFRIIRKRMHELLRTVYAFAELQQRVSFARSFLAQDVIEPHPTSRLGNVFRTGLPNSSSFNLGVRSKRVQNVRK